MSAGLGAGSGGGAGDGSQHPVVYVIPPLEAWYHLPVHEQLQRIIAWRDEQLANQPNLRSFASAATPAQVFPPQEAPSAYPDPPEIASRRVEAHHSTAYHPTVDEPPYDEPTDLRGRGGIPVSTSVLPPNPIQSGFTATEQDDQPAPLNLPIYKTARTPAHVEGARDERETSSDQDYQPEVLRSRPFIPTSYALVPRTPAPGQPIGPIYVSASPATPAVVSHQIDPSVGNQAHASFSSQFRPFISQGTDAASTELPVVQSLSIRDSVAGPGPTTAIESSSVNHRPAATAAAEPYPEPGISDVRDITFPHLDDLEFQPLTAPAKEPVSNASQASPTSPAEDTEAASSKTAKNRAQKAKQKAKQKANKKAKKAAAASPAAPAVEPDEVQTPETVNQSPASPKDVTAPITKSQAKKARKKAKKAAATAAEAEEDDFLRKMKEDSMLFSPPT